MTDTADASLSNIVNTFTNEERLEIQQQLDRIAEGDADTVSHEELMLQIGKTARQIVSETGVSDEEIMAQFGLTRAQLEESLGLPSKAEVRAYHRRHAIPS